MNNSYNEYFRVAKKNKPKSKVELKLKQVKNRGNRIFAKINSVHGTTKPQSSSSKKPYISGRNTASSNFALFILFALGASIAGWGYLNIDYVINFIDRVEISPFAISEAVEKVEEKKSSDKSVKEARISSGNELSSANKDLSSEKNREENINHFTKLNDRKTELDLREKELNELESELHEQRREIENRIKKLEEIRSQIGQVLKDKVEVDEERIKKLVEFYSDMKPQNAAQIVATLNEDLAVEILGRMKKKNAADILNLLKPEKAQVLTEKFAGYKRR